MKQLRQLGLALIMLAAAGAASAGNHRHDHGYKHGPHHQQQQYTECKVIRKVTHNGRYYREETICKTSPLVHARHSRKPVHAHRPPPPPRHAHVVHMPPPPAIVIGPHGVKVHGAVHIGW